MDRIPQDVIDETERDLEAHRNNMLAAIDDYVENVVSWRCYQENQALRQRLQEVRMYLIDKDRVAYEMTQKPLQLNTVNEPMAVLPQAEVDGYKRDAALWHALLNCARIRIIGTAGLDSFGNPLPERGNFVHFGAEFWTQHDAKTPDDYAEKVLTNFATAAGRELVKPTA